MRPLVIALAACLVLAVAACGGNDGAKSAGPAPSVSVETAPPATSRDVTTGVPSTSGYAQLVEYVAQADAFCKTATDKLEAALVELPEGANLWGTAFEQLAYDLSGEALAQLRALPPPEAPAVNPVALCSHRGGSHESASGPTRAEFIAQANEICRAADSRSSSEIPWGDSPDFPGMTGPEAAETAARIMEETLAQLRALPQPEADRALLEEGFYQVVEREIDAIREMGAAAAAGDTARWFLLGSENVHLRHQRDAFVGEYGLEIGPGRSCPMALPA